MNDITWLVYLRFAIEVPFTPSSKLILLSKLLALEKSVHFKTCAVALAPYKIIGQCQTHQAFCSVISIFADTYTAQLRNQNDFQHIITAAFSPVKGGNTNRVISLFNNASIEHRK